MALPGRVLLSAAESCINLLKTFRSSEKLGHNFPDLFRLRCAPQHGRGSPRAAVAGLARLVGSEAADENGLKLPHGTAQPAKK